MQRESDPVLEELAAVEASLARLHAHLEARECIPRAAAQIEVLACTVGEHTAAISLPLVEELVLLPRLTPLTDVPAWVIGTMNLRGQRVPVIDVLARIEQRPREQALSDAIVVVRFQGRRSGLVVQDVAGVERVPSELLRLAINEIALAKYVLAVLPVQDRAGLLLSVARLTSNTKELSL
jgi:chemotaxis signal transduction protein